MRKFYLFSALLAGVFLFQSCVNEEDFDFDRVAQTTINPTVGAPLLDTEIRMSDFVDFDTLISLNEGMELATRLGEDGGSYLELVYAMENEFDVSGFINQIEQLQGAYVEFPAIEVPNISEWAGELGELFDVTLTLPEGAEGEPADISVEIQELEEGISLDSIRLRAGGVSIVSNTGLPFDVDLILSSSSIRNNVTGEFFCDTIPLATPDGMLDVPLLDLTNSTVMLKDSAELPGKLFLDFRYSVVIHFNSNTSSTGGSYALNLGLEISPLEIEAAYGKVGTNIVPICDTIDIDIFEDSEFRNYVDEGGIDLEKLRFELAAKTTIGIGAVIKPKVYSITSDGVQTQFFGEEDSIYLQRSSYPGIISDSTVSVLETDAAAIEILPNKIVYNLDAYFSDSFFDETYPAFVLPHNAKLQLWATTSLPVKAKFNDLHYEQDAEFMEFLQDIDYLKSASLRLVVENELPAVTQLDFFMLDSLGVVMDTLFDKPITMNGAPVDVNGNVLAPTAQTIEIKMTADKYKLLQKAAKIRMAVKLNTSSASNNERPYVRFKKEAAIRIKASVKAETNITF